jgi:hypothetical protein
MKRSAVLLGFTAVLLLFFTMAEGHQTTTYIKYTTVSGYFEQDDPKTNASTFDYVRRLTLSSL